MDLGLMLVVGVPAAWHLGLAGYVYYDAGRSGMAAVKWGAVACLIPLFGFFAYLFERGERDYDPGEDPYAGGGYNVHESRAGVERGSRSGDDPGGNQGSIEEGYDERDP